MDTYVINKEIKKKEKAPVHICLSQRQVIQGKTDQIHNQSTTPIYLGELTFRDVQNVICPRFFCLRIKIIFMFPTKHACKVDPPGLRICEGPWTACGSTSPVHPVGGPMLPAFKGLQGRQRRANEQELTGAPSPCGRHRALLGTWRAASPSS